VESLDADLLADDLRELVRGCDAVVHLSSRFPEQEDHEDRQLAGRILTAGTRRLLDAAIACRVPRYVHQSCVTVYRDGGDRWLDEDAALDESVCRPIVETEAMIREVEPAAIAWTVLRAGSFVGTGTSQDALVDRLRAGAVVVAGDGSNYVSPLNVRDLATAVAAAVERAPARSTFNVVDEPLRYGDYVDALADLIGVTRPRRDTLRPLPSSRRCANTAALTVLRWMPRHSIWPSRQASPDTLRA
jgi:nucleoside-diphosphate-sugar epimerase